MDSIWAADFSGATSCRIGTLASTIGTPQNSTACESCRASRRADIAPTRTTMSPWGRCTCRANSDRILRTDPVGRQRPARESPHGACPSYYAGVREIGGMGVAREIAPDPLALRLVRLAGLGQGVEHRGGGDGPPHHRLARQDEHAFDPPRDSAADK